MKDKYEGCYIDGYKDHYAVFADNGEKLAEYDTHKEAKEDIAEWEAEVKNESYIPADTLATGYRFTIHETELLENAIKKHVEQKVDQGVNAMFDTDSEEFKKVGNEPYDKSQWWDDMKLTMRIKKTPFPRKNGYTNGDFRPNQKWLMGAIECCKSARDCEYLLKDAYLSVAHDKKLIQNLKSVRDGNPNKYVNVKVVQKWLDNGVTPEKVEKHIEWFKANYIKGLQAKKKEFNKAQNETATEDPMNEGLFGLGKKKNKEIPEVSIDEIKIIPTNFRKAYDGWWFYLSFKDNNIDKEMLCAISNHIRKICNSEHGFDAYPTEFMICSPKDIVREYKVNDYYDKEYLKNKNNIIIFNYEFVGKPNINSVSVLKQQLGARYFNDVVNNAVYYQITDDPKNKGIPIPDIINNSKNYAVSYIDKDTLMAMYNYFASRSTKNESVTFYDSNTPIKKNLNEDHSEISNDPEMEELMALAGVTTADLDDLENDNDLDLDEDDPIYANTLREIDAAMDESVKSAINNIELATKGMDVNIEQIEKFIPVAKDFLKYMKSAPIAYDENTGDGLKIKNDTVDFINRCLKFDYDRGSDDELKIIGRNWIKYNLATLFDKLSFNNKKVSPAQLELYKKCVKGGEFDKRLQKCYNELKAILKELNDFYDQLAKKLGSDFEKTVNYKMLNSFGNEYNYFWGQYCFTTGDKNATMKYAGRTRVSFFGKRVRDSINESIGDFIRDTKNYFKNASEFLKHRKENSKSKGKDSEDNIKNTPAYKDASKKLDAFGDSIAEKVVAHLKEYATKNNFKSVYNNTAFNINDIKYCPINGYDVQISNLQDGIDYNQVSSWEQKNPEKDWQKEPQFNNEWYHELLTEGEEFAKSLLQKDCPDIYDYYVNTGDGDEGLVYIDISLSNAYINTIKEDAKKSQNESVDINLDILLAESAEFLFDE